MSHLFLSHAANLPVVKPSSRGVPDRSIHEIRSQLGQLDVELPDDEYFDAFLVELHHRQRQDVMMQSSWRVVWERIQAGVWKSSGWLLGGILFFVIVATALYGFYA